MLMPLPLLSSLLLPQALHEQEQAFCPAACKGIKEEDTQKAWQMIYTERQRSEAQGLRHFPLCAEEASSFVFMSSRARRCLPPILRGFMEAEIRSYV